MDGKKDENLRLPRFPQKLKSQLNTSLAVTYSNQSSQRKHKNKDWDLLDFTTFFISLLPRIFIHMFLLLILTNRCRLKGY